MDVQYNPILEESDIEKYPSKIPKMDYQYNPIFDGYYAK